MRRHASVLRGLRGPADATIDAAVAALIETQSLASHALEEGAIDESTYEAILSSADQIEVEISAGSSEPEALLAEATELRDSTAERRTSGGSAHRTNMILATIAAGVSSVVIVLGLTAFANRRSHR